MIDRGTIDWSVCVLYVLRVFISIARRWLLGSAVGHNNEGFMANVAEYIQILYRFQNIHARVTVKWPWVYLYLLIPKTQKG